MDTAATPPHVATPLLACLAVASRLPKVDSSAALLLGLLATVPCSGRRLPIAVSLQAAAGLLKFEELVLAAAEELQKCY